MNPSDRIQRANEVLNRIHLLHGRIETLKTLLQEINPDEDPDTYRAVFKLATRAVEEERALLTEFVTLNNEMTTATTGGDSDRG